MKTLALIMVRGEVLEFGYLLCFFINEAILINNRTDEIEFGYLLCCIGTIV